MLISCYKYFGHTPRVLPTGAKKPSCLHRPGSLNSEGAFLMQPSNYVLEGYICIDPISCSLIFSILGQYCLSDKLNSTEPARKN